MTLGSSTRPIGVETLEESEEEARKEKELEQKLVALEFEMAELAKKADAEKVELTKQLEAVTKSKDDEESAHKAVVEEMTKKLAEYEMQVKELEGHPDRWNFRELHIGENPR